MIEESEIKLKRMVTPIFSIKNFKGRIIFSHCESLFTSFGPYEVSIIFQSDRKTRMPIYPNVFGVYLKGKLVSILKSEEELSALKEEYIRKTDNGRA